VPHPRRAGGAGLGGPKGPLSRGRPRPFPLHPLLRPGAADPRLHLHRRALARPLRPGGGALARRLRHRLPRRGFPHQGLPAAGRRRLHRARADQGGDRGTGGDQDLHQPGQRRRDGEHDARRRPGERDDSPGERSERAGSGRPGHLPQRHGCEDPGRGDRRHQDPERQQAAARGVQHHPGTGWRQGPL